MHVCNWVFRRLADVACWAQQLDVVRLMLATELEWDDVINVVFLGYANSANWAFPALIAADPRNRSFRQSPNFDAASSLIELAHLVRVLCSVLASSFAGFVSPPH